MVMPQEDVGLAWNRNRWMKYSIAPQAPIPMAKNAASTCGPSEAFSKDCRAFHATSGSHNDGTIHHGVLVKFSIHSFSKNRKVIRCCGRYTHWLYSSPSCPTCATTARSKFTSIASAPRAAHVSFCDAPSVPPSTSTRTTPALPETPVVPRMLIRAGFTDLSLRPDPSAKAGTSVTANEVWLVDEERKSDETRRSRTNRRARPTTLVCSPVDRCNSMAWNRTPATDEKLNARRAIANVDDDLFSKALDSPVDVQTQPNSFSNHPATAEGTGAANEQHVPSRKTRCEPMQQPLHGPFLVDRRANLLAWRRPRTEPIRGRSRAREFLLTRNVHVAVRLRADAPSP
mmetsp:Transcript_9905/g.60412  ORF Transcript_9905/g.60412 Transcript_9905/m.60412 type:complete len:343 (+) Transcript_9905:1259-2287(+)